MGIIIKESIKQSGIRLTFAVIGALATMFVYPLDDDLYGILGYILNTAVLVAPLVMIGLGQASIRYFSFHNAEVKERRDFLFYLLGLFVLNCIIYFGLVYMFRDVIVKLSTNPDKDFGSYINYALLGAVLFGLIQFLVQYLSNYRKVSIPIIWQNIHRVTLPLALLLILWNKFTLDQGICFVLGSLLLSAGVLLFSSFSSLSETDLRSTEVSHENQKKKGFYKFYFWAFATSIGSLVAFRIDVLMIGSMIDFQATRDYLIALFLTNVVAYPIQSVLTISAPIIAQSWKDMNLTNIGEIYLKGSKNLLYVGAAILFSILIAVQLFAIILPKWADLKYVQIIIFILGISKLFDMMSSVNGMIIQYSKWYRYNTYFILMLTGVNILLNYYLISHLGIIGAAIATLISLTLFNIIKCVFLYEKIKIHPYTRSNISFFISSILMMSLILYFDLLWPGWVSLCLSGILALAYLIITLFYFIFAPDTKKIIVTALNKLK